MSDTQALTPTTAFQLIREQLPHGPFSFLYGDVPSREFLPSWTFTQETHALDAQRTGHTLYWSDPAGGLRVRCEVIEYADAPAAEWVLYFRNAGSAPTPILADIQALDASFACAAWQPCCVRGAKGSTCRRDDFAPLRHPLGADSINPQYPTVNANHPLSFASQGGRSSCGTLPFFNIDMGERGIIGAIGWTGDWAACFWREEAGGIHARAGMQRTHLTLHPGEEIRSPRILLFPWEGELVDAHNLFRRFILAHYTPRPDDAPLHAPISLAVWGRSTAHGNWRRFAGCTSMRSPSTISGSMPGGMATPPSRKARPSSTVNGGHRSATGGPIPLPIRRDWRPSAKRHRRPGMRFTLWLEP